MGTTAGPRPKSLSRQPGREAAKTASQIISHGFPVDPDPPQGPWGRGPKDSSQWSSAATTRMVPLDSLVATQEGIDPQVLAQYRSGQRESRTLPRVAHEDGINYLIDGHTRAALAREQGRTHIRARYWQEPARRRTAAIEHQPFGESGHWFEDYDADGNSRGHAKTEERPDHVWVDKVVVNPHERGKGVGSGLLDHIQSHFGKPLRLNPYPVGEQESDPDEEELRGWYGRRGFTDYERQPGDPHEAHDWMERHAAAAKPEFPCLDCGADTLGDTKPGNVAENFRVHDHVWQQAGLDRGSICIGCLENRLGRTLNRHDFPKVPVNDLSVDSNPRYAWSFRSPRFVDRLTREASAWQPSSGVFGPTTGYDEVLFDEHHELRPEVRRDIMERLDQALRVDTGVAGSDWQEWLKVYIAGGSASEWAGGRPNDTAQDLDVLIGVNYPEAKRGSLAMQDMDHDQIDTALNVALRNAFNESDWHPGFGGHWSLTGYVNPNAWDITAIKPYAAYNISDMKWAVKPPHLPEHTVADFDPAVIQIARAVAAEARAILRLPEPVRIREARALWERLHSERRMAFSEQGEGWQDVGNLVEKYLAYHPAKLLEKIRELALAPPSAQMKTASAGVQNLPIEQVGRMRSSTWGGTVEDAYRNERYNEREQIHARQHGYPSAEEYQAALRDHVAEHGIGNAVLHWTDHDGQELLGSGHHRYYVARDLGLTHLPATNQQQEQRDMPGWNDHLAVKIAVATGVWYHGTPDERNWEHGAANGLHIGTEEAARQALNARIGKPHEGEWDGTRLYGRTLLSPAQVTGVERNLTVPRYPCGRAKYSDGTQIPADARPNIFPVRVKGEMLNTPQTPVEDDYANSRMHGQITRGQARRGYYYTNIGEDDGSLSAVVPSAAHLERIDRQEKTAALPGDGLSHLDQPERPVPAPGEPQLEATDYEGAVGNSTHITRVEHGLIPTSSIAHLEGASGERPGDSPWHRRGEDWDRFKDRIGREGIQDPVFITVDHGKEPRIVEGNQRRDAAVELGHSHVPVEIRYFGHAEQQGTVHERAQRQQHTASVEPYDEESGEPRPWYRRWPGESDEDATARRGRYVQQVADRHGVSPAAAHKVIRHVGGDLAGDLGFTDGRKYGFANDPGNHDVFSEEEIRHLMSPEMWHGVPVTQVSTKDLHSTQNWLRPRTLAHNLFHPGKKQGASDAEEGHPDFDPDDLPREEEDYSDIAEEARPHPDLGQHTRFMRRDSGEMTILDGHHRTAIDIALGKKTTPGTVIDESRLRAAMKPQVHLHDEEMSAQELHAHMLQHHDRTKSELPESRDASQLDLLDEHDHAHEFEDPGHEHEVPAGSREPGRIPADVIDRYAAADHLVLYHGTSRENADAIAQSGLRAPEGHWYPAQWPVTTVNRQTADAYATRGDEHATVEIHVPRHRADEYLWPAQDHIGGAAYAPKKDLPAAWVHAVHPVTEPVDYPADEPTAKTAAKDSIFIPPALSDEALEKAKTTPHAIASYAAQHQLAYDHPRVMMRFPSGNDGDAMMRHVFKHVGYSGPTEGTFAARVPDPSRGTSHPSWINGKPGVALHPDAWNYRTALHEAAHHALMYDRAIGPNEHQPDEQIHGDKWAGHYASGLNWMSPGAGDDFLAHRQHYLEQIAAHHGMPKTAAVQEPEYYHGTSAELHEGDVITPEHGGTGGKTWFARRRGDAGFYALQDANIRAPGSPGHVYRVMPHAEEHEFGTGRTEDEFWSHKPLEVLGEEPFEHWGPEVYGKPLAQEGGRWTYRKEAAAEPGSDGDDYFTCAKGHEHWGKYGAAGLLIRHRGDDNLWRYLLQKRGGDEEVDHGGKWSIPSGAIGEDEDPLEGAKREYREEMGPLPRGVEHHHSVVSTDCGNWQFTTHVMDAPEAFMPRGGGETEDEVSGAAWHTAKEVNKLKEAGELHPAFAESWDQARRSRGPKEAAWDRRAPLYHGTRTREPLQPGDLIEPGHQSNWPEQTWDKKSKHVYATDNLWEATGFAEQARRPHRGRVYEVEPTGRLLKDREEAAGTEGEDDDPAERNSYMSLHPLRVVREVPHHQLGREFDLKPIPQHLWDADESLAGEYGDWASHHAAKPEHPTKTKPEVNYHKATGSKNCGNCIMVHLLGPDFESGRCDLVKGLVNVEDVCDEWEPDEEHKTAATDGGSHSRSSFIYLDVPPELIRQEPGGVADSHITVVFLGKDLDDERFAEVCRRAAEAAKATQPMSGVLHGLDTFRPSASSDGKTPAFVPAYVPGIGDLRRKLEDLSASEHKDYRPHVTLGYYGEGEPLPPPHPPVRVRFTHLNIKRGDQVTSLPLGESALHEAAYRQPPTEETWEARRQRVERYLDRQGDIMHFPANWGPHTPNYFAHGLIAEHDGPVRDEHWEHLPTQDVSLRQPIHTHQGYVYTDTVKHYLNADADPDIFYESGEYTPGGDEPKIVRHHGTHYLLDGNHRYAKDRLMGHESMTAKVFDTADPGHKQANCYECHKDEAENDYDHDSATCPTCQKHGWSVW